MLQSDNGEKIIQAKRPRVLIINCTLSWKAHILIRNLRFYIFYQSHYDDEDICIILECHKKIQQY